ncbi:MAG: hypothetical protein PHY13_00165 [Clostridia bacterium]|nr:hypothetical protein [Clostridia bacterium]MDD4542169.1 hypothetical protein [Clostridia bacterium]
MRLIKITSCVVLLFILLIFTMSSNTVINTPVIEGQVYIDENMNGTLDCEDTFLKGIEIGLTKRVNKVITKSGLIIEEYEPVSTTICNRRGRFSFEISEKASYRVIIETDNIMQKYIYDVVDINSVFSLTDHSIRLRLTRLPQKVYDTSKMTSIDLIDQAYDMSEITEDEKIWLYAKYYKGEELPERYKSNIEGPDITSIYFQLYQYIVKNDDKELNEYINGIPQDIYD